jgi:hypothetical protein
LTTPPTYRWLTGFDIILAHCLVDWVMGNASVFLDDSSRPCLQRKRSGIAYSSTSWGVETTLQSPSRRPLRSINTDKDRRRVVSIALEPDSNRVMRLLYPSSAPYRVTTAPPAAGSSYRNVIVPRLTQTTTPRRIGFQHTPVSQHNASCCWIMRHVELQCP